jgi:dUTP pyrophosphatase
MDYIIDAIYSLINSRVTFKVKLLTYDALSPYKSYKGSAGFDVFSVESATINPGSRALIKTGISIEIPEYYYVRVAPRSGLSVQGIDVGAGVVDSSYRGEINVLLINNSQEPFIVEEGAKIAQLIMERCACPIIDIIEDEELSSTERGERGFGSSGK